MKSDRHLRFNHQRRPDERTDIIAACCLAGRVSVLLTSARRHPTVTTASHTRLPRRGLAGTRGDSMLAVSVPAAPPRRARPPARGRHGGEGAPDAPLPPAVPRRAALTAAVAYAAVARELRGAPRVRVHRLPRVRRRPKSRRGARDERREPLRGGLRGCPRHRRRHGPGGPRRGLVPRRRRRRPPRRKNSLSAPHTRRRRNVSARHLRREDRARAPERPGVHAEGPGPRRPPGDGARGGAALERDAAERRRSRSRRPVPRVPRLAVRPRRPRRGARRVRVPGRRAGVRGIPREPGDGLRADETGRQTGGEPVGVERPSLGRGPRRRREARATVLRSLFVLR